MEKSMILNGKQNINNGVLLISDKGYIKLNLNVPDEQYLLVVKSDKIYVFSVKKEDIFSIDFAFTDITVLLIKDNNIVLYGASNNDRIAAFTLFSDYKKMLKSGKINVIEPTKYEIKKEENEQISLKKEEKPIEKPTKKNEKNIKNDDILKDNIDEKSAFNEENNSNEIDDISEELKQKLENKEEENINKSKANNSSFTSNIMSSSDKMFDDTIVYKGDNFYLAVHNQIDEIFVCYPEEKVLESLVSNSKWAKIEYEVDKYYSVGIIKENDEVKYICYAIPSYFSMPPQEIANFCRWLPLDKNNSQNKGYWVVYQDGKTGRTLTN